MRTTIILFIAILSSFILKGQDGPSIIQEFDLYGDFGDPSKVTEEQYGKGQYILKQVLDQLNSGEDIEAADYWNLAMALRYMGGRKDQVAKSFQRALEIDKDRIWSYVKAFEEMGKSFEELRNLIPEVFIPFYEESQLKDSEESDVDA